MIASAFAAFSIQRTELVQPLHYVEDTIALIEATHGRALVEMRLRPVCILPPISSPICENRWASTCSKKLPRKGSIGNAAGSISRSSIRAWRTIFRDIRRQNSLLRQHDCMSQIYLIEFAHLTLLAGQPGNVIVFDQSVGRRAAEAGFRRRISGSTSGFFIDKSSSTATMMVHEHKVRHHRPRSVARLSGPSARVCNKHATRIPECSTSIIVHKILLDETWIRWSSNMKIAKAFGMTVPAIMDAGVTIDRRTCVSSADDRSPVAPGVEA